MVGLGGQDSLEEAQAFVERYGTKSFQMLWDPNLESWRQLGVTGTPTFVVFDGEGQPVDAWIGPFDEAKALDLARRA